MRPSVDILADIRNSEGAAEGAAMLRELADRIESGDLVCQATLRLIVDSEFADGFKNPIPDRFIVARFIVASNITVRLEVQE